MSPPDLALLLLAGIGAGLSGSVAGVASFVSYPALLGVGLGPVAANVTNAIALNFSLAGNVAGSAPELAGRWALARRLMLAAVPGGMIGGALLLLTPATAFERIVPGLIGLSALAVLVRPRGRAAERTRTVPLYTGMFLTGIYGGYFGAAAGVLALALLLHLTGTPIAQASGLRAVVIGSANAVAAVGFALFGPVHWPEALALGLGCLLGGRVGPVILRRVPERPLRLLIAAAGLAVAAKLWLDG